MNQWSSNSYSGIFLIMLVLFGCAATTATPTAVVTEPVTEPIPGQWVNTSEVKDPAEPPASLSVKRPSSTEQIRYENCENNDEIVAEGPPSSEVGVAVPVEGRSNIKPAYAFSRHYCKTEVHN